MPFPYCFRCPYDKKVEDCGLYCLKQFEQNFDTEYNSFWDAKAGESEFSAFYIEPIQGTGGYVIPPPGYFAGLRKILDERHILMVDDEIQMGFYRAGKFWAIENFGVTPDIIVFGKGADQRPESAERRVGARGPHLARGVPARIDALDLLVEHARHGGGARSRPHDGGTRLRGNDTPEGRVFPRADQGSAAPLSEGHRPHRRHGHGACASRSAARTDSSPIAS